MPSPLKNNMSIEHNIIAEGEIHVPHQWVYATPADRLAAVIISSDDVNKLALQLSDSSYWRLATVSPTTWVAVMGPQGEAFKIDAQGTLAERDAYDAETPPFTYLDTDAGNLYFKNSATSGDWSDPVAFARGVPPGGTDGQVIVKSGGVDYVTAWHTLVKADVGLGQVDNTPDADKPVSTPTQTALDTLQSTLETSISEVQGDVDTNTTNISTLSGELSTLDGEVVKSVNGLTPTSGNVVLDAEDIAITDAGGHFTGTDVEAALQETGADIASLETNKVDKDGTKVLSTNDYTDAEKTKLASLNEHWRGTYVSLAALQAAIPTGNVGDYALVDEGAGSDVAQYNWDDTDSAWTLSSGGVVSSTDVVPEGSTNLYFTTTRVLNTALTGLSLLTGTAVVSADSVLVAFGKLQKQITDALARITTNETNIGTAQTDITTLEGDVSTLQTDVTALEDTHIPPYYKHPYEVTTALVIGDGERAISAGYEVTGSGSIEVTGDGELVVVG